MKKRGILKSFIKQYILILITLCCTRIWFLNVNNDGSLTWNEILKSFYIGVKFDASIGGIIMVFLLLLFLLSRVISLKKLWFKISMGIYGILIFITVYFSAGNIYYYREFKTQLDASIFEYAGDSEIYGNMGAIFNLPLIYGLICILAIINLCLSYKNLKEIYLADKLGNIKKNSLSFIFLILVVFIGIRGLQNRPRNVEHGFFSKNNLANQMTQNGMLSLIHSIDRQREFKNIDLKKLEFFDNEELIKRSRELVGSKNNKFLSDQNPLLRITDTKKPLKDKNVVLIIAESLSGQYIGALGHNDPDLAPYFSELSKKGVLFTSFYGNGTRTRNGVLSTNVSFPVQVGRDLMRDPAVQKPFYGLPRILKDRGYNTNFYHGSRLNFDNMQGVLLTNGMDNFIGEKDFPKGITSKYHWGAPDTVLFDRSAKEIKKLKEPFFAEILTISNHSPFEIPKEYDKLDEYTKKYGSRDRNAGTDDSLMMRYNAYRYMDTAFEEFFESIKDEPWYMDTLFVIVSDHEINGMHNNIPLLLYTPDGSLKPQKIDSIGSQVDILPTVMGYLGGSYKNASWGKDILNAKDGERMAYTKSPKQFEKAVIMYKDYYYEKNGRNFSLKDRKTLKNLDSKGKENDIEKMEDFIKLHLQLSEIMIRKRSFADVDDDMSLKDLKSH
ncbi:MAG: sulfatase-like hydrolase/transferase [Psychrilyobacter sp.]|uniref:LTA synthase family protein n=1 Tax=Psychrilyobacter sp. TaxID=2586924 RepID=UPI003C75159F